VEIPRTPSNLPAVLIVDNDPGNLLALESVLDRLGCRIVVARSGTEAIALASADHFAAILMDVRMPGLDGYATGSFIRQHPQSAHTPILFISAQDDVDVARLTRLYGETGQVDSIQKPVAPEVLRSKVRTWLQLFQNDQRVHELEQAMSFVQGDARRKTDILAMVAHDLKSPLSAIGVSVGTLRRQTQRNELAISKLLVSVTHHLDLVDRSVARMNAMVRDLLHAARMDSGPLELDLTLEQMHDVVEQALGLLHPLAEQNQIGIKYDRGEPDAAVMCDRDRVLQVLSNLLGNAVKFTAPGGTVEVELARSTDQNVIVCVSDTGPGIAPDQVPFVFEKYWQGTHTSRRQGTGLGLAIAREIVNAHNGKIWVESRLGSGSRFYFSLPCFDSRPDSNRE
jgi:signal transduction histidine kinase